jgi:hypothetical protein
MTASDPPLCVTGDTGDDIDTARRRWAALVLDPAATDAECAAARATLKVHLSRMSAAEQVVRSECRITPPGRTC